MLLKSPQEEVAQVTIVLNIQNQVEAQPCIALSRAIGAIQRSICETPTPSNQWV